MFFRKWACPENDVLFTSRKLDWLWRHDSAPSPLSLFPKSLRPNAWSVRFSEIQDCSLTYFCSFAFPLCQNANHDGYMLCPRLKTSRRFRDYFATLPSPHSPKNRLEWVTRPVWFSKRQSCPRTWICCFVSSKTSRIWQFRKPTSCAIHDSSNLFSETHPRSTPCILSAPRKTWRENPKWLCSFRLLTDQEFHVIKTTFIWAA
jgi:hypothetical protein